MWTYFFSFPTLGPKQVLAPPCSLKTNWKVFHFLWSRNHHSAILLQVFIMILTDSSKAQGVKRFGCSFFFFDSITDLLSNRGVRHAAHETIWSGPQVLDVAQWGPAQGMCFMLCPTQPALWADSSMAHSWAGLAGCSTHPVPAPASPAPHPPKLCVALVAHVPPAVQVIKHPRAMCAAYDPGVWHRKHTTLCCAIVLFADSGEPSPDCRLAQQCSSGLQGQMHLAALLYKLGTVIGLPVSWFIYI